jgi:hypothetical protein
MLMLVASEDNPDMNQDPNSPTTSSESSSSESTASSSPVDSTTNASSTSSTEPTTPSSSVDSSSGESIPVSTSTGSDSSASSTETSSSDPAPNTDTSAPEPPAPQVSQPAPVISKKSGSKIKKFLGIILLLIILAAVGGGAYTYGKNHEKIVIQSPAAKPVNLPPQATPLTACVPGRGKQYIIPKDIPNGPIYDVYKSKVIAIEYNLNLEKILTDSSTFSDAILNVTKNYPVDHFSLVPTTTESATPTAVSAQSFPSDIHIVMFMVPASESAQIVCSQSSTTTTTTKSTTTTPSTSTSSSNSTSTKSTTTK